ncbi:hypothetical protein J4227_03350 [Candidatus Woesearchaeota archaeon]|nr:hypothetical protein [Candidatus Woesearchaeota archaeon]
MDKLYTQKIVRHGHKNNDPNAHGAGTEALLDSSKLFYIVNYAGEIMHGLHGDENVIIGTSPVDRARATAGIVYEILNIDPRLNGEKNGARRLAGPNVVPLIGSYAMDRDGKAVNLGPKAMSDLWAEAKKSDTYAAGDGEHAPLRAWLEQGLDNPQAGNPADPGISLREYACRIGAHFYRSLNLFNESKVSNIRPKQLDINFGHSGDIEFFLYLTLDMLMGKDGSDPERLIKYFEQTGGALEPLTGIEVEYDSRHPHSVVFRQRGLAGFEKPSVRTEVDLGMEILQEQDRWLRENGKSQEVLEQKIAMTKLR